MWVVPVGRLGRRARRPHCRRRPPAWTVLQVLLGFRLLYLYCRSFRTLCGTWLAWASMAVPAWFMIWSRVKFTISRLMSVARTRDSDDERFSAATERLATMCSKRFCVAPRVDRAVETLAMAESSRAIAEVAPALVVTSMLESCTENRPDVDVVSINRFWARLSWFAPPEPAPTWKARAAPVAL